MTDEESDDGERRPAVWTITSSGVITGTVTATGINLTRIVDDIFVHTGVQAVYMDDFWGTHVKDFKEFCDSTQFGIFTGVPLTNQEDCYQCQEVSGALIFSLIMSVVTYIPTVSTNFNRMYPNYDVNCQKSLALIAKLVDILQAGDFPWHIVNFVLAFEKRYLQSPQPGL